MSPVLLDRINQVMALSLSEGNHEDFEHGMCVMEAAAYVANEPWSDHPPCVCPVIAAFMRAWNDGLPSDAERDRLLKPLIESLIDTRSTGAVEERRSYLALDWLIRVCTPKWLDLVPSLAPHAKALRDLEVIADMAGATAVGALTRTARDAARAADWATDWAAAWATDWATDWAAAWAADWAATRAAARAADWATDWAAAWAAAGAAAGATDWATDWAATRAAAGAAAWDAAWDALKPTTAWLQQSALDLVHRMIEVKP